MRRLLFIVIACFLLAFYFDNTPSFSSVNHKDYIVSCVRSDGTIEEIALEDYVLGVVAGEMPASFELEALKAQAVAARTYVLSRNLSVDDSTASQVYQDEEERKAKWQENFEVYESKLKEAVNATKGEVLMYEGNYISALFFSSSNGKTENNEDYFDANAIPYLRCVSSEYEEPIVEYQTFSYDKIASVFGQSDIKILNYTQSGRVNEVLIGEEIYSGRQVRESLNLNSNAFSIVSIDGGYAFTTYGYGHGVGMSQYGANGMATHGYTYDEILMHYYQGACINQLE